jgi:putative ABC transport system permease protein
VVIDRQQAEDQGLRVGQVVGLSTRSGVQDVEISGIGEWGGGTSIGGATLVVPRLEDVQRWFQRPGDLTRIAIAADPGVAPARLAAAVRAALPRTVTVKTGAADAAKQADAANDAIGSVLTPALLALSGAALLVGAFIIFNTFSITVAQRRREFALLRALGATRAQVLGAVAVEALLVAVAASVAGLLTGLGFATLLGVLFDAAGMGIPRAAMTLAPRTIAIGLGVGIGVTATAALVPAVRATRVPPVAAMRDEAPTEAGRTSRRRVAVVTLVGVLGAVLIAEGLFGDGPASARLAAMGGGALLAFVGVALVSRHVVRPLAAIVGWPLERLGHAAGELARENATRNPARTAITAAALMVGIGLVAFVAVFADGLKASFTGAIDQRARADLIVTSDAATPLPRAAQDRIQVLPDVSATAPQYVDQVQVDGRPVNGVIDMVNGIEPFALRDVYRFTWIHGSDADLQRLGPGAAFVEEQFAKAHRIAVGDSFRLTGPTGRHATLTAIGEYRDPQLLQGVMIDIPQFQALSAARDPLSYLVRLIDRRDVSAAKHDVQSALRPFPSAKVRTRAEYSDFISSRLDQLVYLLYALLAMSVVISMFGIANSLFLSIHERIRELGMLRAVGATAAQVRRLIRYESIITSLIGGVLGTVVGVAFAWLTTFAVKDLGVGFSIPGGQLAAFLVLAVVVGALGAIAPARRAARLSILDAIHSE